MSTRTASVLRTAVINVVGAMDATPDPDHIPSAELLQRLLDAGAVRGDLVGDPRFKSGEAPDGSDLCVRWYAGQLTDFLARSAAGELDPFVFVMGAGMMIDACRTKCPPVD